jgi:hypothetical protein
MHTEVLWRNLTPSVLMGCKGMEWQAVDWIRLAENRKNRRELAYICGSEISGSMQHRDFFFFFH